MVLSDSLNLSWLIRFDPINLIHSNSFNLYSWIFRSSRHSGDYSEETGYVYRASATPDYPTAPPYNPEFPAHQNPYAEQYPTGVIPPNAEYRQPLIQPPPYHDVIAARRWRNKLKIQVCITSFLLYSKIVLFFKITFLVFSTYWNHIHSDWFSVFFKIYFTVKKNQIYLSSMALVYIHLCSTINT